MQLISSGDEAVILSSGFDVVSTNRGQTPLETPVIQKLENPASEQIALRIKAVVNARSYEVRYHEGDGVWKSGGVFASTRGVAIVGLTSGKCCTFQVRAIGGSTGASGWSDVQSRYVL